MKLVLLGIIYKNNKITARLYTYYSDLSIVIFEKSKPTFIKDYKNFIAHLKRLKRESDRIKISKTEMLCSFTNFHPYKYVYSHKTDNATYYVNYGLSKFHLFVFRENELTIESIKANKIDITLENDSRAKELLLRYQNYRNLVDIKTDEPRLLNLKKIFATELYNFLEKEYEISYVPSFKKNLMECVI